jgi:PPP family 3-phenylpropionic acid transporter
VLGITLPYFNLYCYHIGLDGTQIGILSAIKSLLVIFSPVIWGTAADKYQIRRPLYIGCSIANSIVWAGYLFTEDFAWMFLITFISGIFFAPIISFLEAFTMDILGAEKKSYGRIRAWGSISFIVVVIGMGQLLDRYSVSVIIWLICIGAALQSLLSFMLPRVVIAKEKFWVSQWKAFFNRQVLLFLLCAFMMLVSHGTYYGFFSIHLETLGFDKSFIGLCWGLASTAEILVMIGSRKLFRRFSLETVLILSFIVATVRWSLLYAFHSWWVILLTQVMHAATYGAFHMASILYVDQLAPKHNKTLGQAINNAVTYGLGLMVGFLINGFLYEHTDSSKLFLMSAATALFAGILFFSHFVFSKMVRRT